MVSLTGVTGLCNRHGDKGQGGAAMAVTAGSLAGIDLRRLRGKGGGQGAGGKQRRPGSPELFSSS